MDRFWINIHSTERENGEGIRSSGGSEKVNVKKDEKEEMGKRGGRCRWKEEKEEEGVAATLRRPQNDFDVVE